MAFNAGSKIRMLAWRPGLAQAYETTPINGQALWQPQLTVLS
jgi:hypothetical protein